MHCRGGSPAPRIPREDEAANRSPPPRRRRGREGGLPAGDGSRRGPHDSMTTCGGSAPLHRRRRKGAGVAPTGRPAPLQPDLLHDPHRVAAARRLLIEVYGQAAFDRLSGLAARLLGTGHAKVTLFTDQDTVVGGHGLPPGVVGGPALLTGALSALVVRTGAPLVVSCAAEDERVVELQAVSSGQVQAYLGVPLVSASGHVVGVLAAYDSEPRH